ncbi:hypothetical protein V6U90_28700 [Micromonospora sp. CPCC 206060]|uniref:hypothetical protein n=1 Tax=Micromonospora sp. CPCC 206060 TaxID=3122406 RepID=UPI002FF3C21C
MSRRQAAREMQEAVEREILELLAEHGEMTTLQVTAKVRTGRTRTYVNDPEYGELEFYDSWSMSYIRDRLNELWPRVTYGVARWDGARLPQYIWELADPPESKDDE